MHGRETEVVERAREIGIASETCEPSGAVAQRRDRVPELARVEPRNAYVHEKRRRRVRFARALRELERAAKALCRPPHLAAREREARADALCSRLDGRVARRMRRSDESLDDVGRRREVARAERREGCNLTAAGRRARVAQPLRFGSVDERARFIPALEKEPAARSERRRAGALVIRREHLFDRRERSFAIAGETRDLSTKRERSLGALTGERRERLGVACTRPLGVRELERDELGHRTEAIAGETRDRGRALGISGAPRRADSAREGAFGALLVAESRRDERERVVAERGREKRASALDASRLRHRVEDAADEVAPQAETPVAPDRARARANERTDRVARIAPEHHVDGPRPDRASREGEHLAEAPRLHGQPRRVLGRVRTKPSQRLRAPDVGAVREANRERAAEETWEPTARFERGVDELRWGLGRERRAEKSAKRLNGERPHVDACIDAVDRTVGLEHERDRRPVDGRSAHERVRPRGIDRLGALDEDDRVVRRDAIGELRRHDERRRGTARSGARALQRPNRLADEPRAARTRRTDDEHDTGSAEPPDQRAELRLSSHERERLDRHRALRRRGRAERLIRSRRRGSGLVEGREPRRDLASGRRTVRRVRVEQRRDEAPERRRHLDRQALDGTWAAGGAPEEVRGRARARVVEDGPAAEQAMERRAEPVQNPSRSCARRARPPARDTPVCP